MPWIVYNGNREVVAVFAAQGPATGFAAQDADWTAHDSETTGDDWDDLAQAGWHFTTDGAVQRYPAEDSSDLAVLKRTVHAALARYRELTHALLLSAPGRPPSDNEKLQTFVWRALQGFYTQMNDTSIAVGRRTTIAERFGDGPADVTQTRGTETVQDVSKWWELIHTATAPTSMVSYVGSSDQARVNVGAAVAISGNEPAASVDLLRGEWVEDIAS